MTLRRTMWVDLMVIGLSLAFSNNCGGRRVERNSLGISYNPPPPGVDCRGVAITKIETLEIAEGASQTIASLIGSTGKIPSSLIWTVDGQVVGAGNRVNRALTEGTHQIHAALSNGNCGDSFTMNVIRIPKPPRPPIPYPLPSASPTPQATSIQARLVTNTSLIRGRVVEFAIDNLSALQDHSINWGDGTTSQILTHAFAISGQLNVVFSARDRGTGTPLSSRITVSVIPDRVTVDTREYYFLETPGWMQCRPPRTFPYKDPVTGAPRSKPFQECRDGGLDPRGNYVLHHNSSGSTALDQFVRNANNTGWAANLIHDYTWLTQVGQPPTAPPAQQGPPFTWVAPPPSWRCPSNLGDRCESGRLNFGMHNYPDIITNVPVVLDSDGKDSAGNFVLIPGLVDPIPLPPIGTPLFDLWQFDLNTLRSSVLEAKNYPTPKSGFAVIDGINLGGDLGYQTSILVLDGADTLYLERHFSVRGWGRFNEVNGMDPDGDGHFAPYSSLENHQGSFVTRLPGQPNTPLPHELQDTYNPLYPDPNDPRNFLASKFVGDDYLSAGYAVSPDTACNLRQPAQPPYSGALSYYTVPPCRLVETADPVNTYSGDWKKPIGGPNLKAHEWREYYVYGRCGIPRGAKAIDVNVTYTNATGDGYIAFSPDCRQFTASKTSQVSLKPGKSRANHMILNLDTYGYGRIRSYTDTAGARMIIDVSGYFQ